MGQRVKFKTGNRTLEGYISGCYTNSADAVVYQITRNRQTFTIYESNIMEKLTKGKCPICNSIGKLPKDKKAREQGYRLCVNPSCNNSVYKVN